MTAAARRSAGRGAAPRRTRTGKDGDERRSRPRSAALPERLPPGGRVRRTDRVSAPGTWPAPRTPAPRPRTKGGIDEGGRREEGMERTSPASGSLWTVGAVGPARRNEARSVGGGVCGRAGGAGGAAAGEGSAFGIRADESRKVIQRPVGLDTNLFIRQAARRMLAACCERTGRSSGSRPDRLELPDLLPNPYPGPDPERRCARHDASEGRNPFQRPLRTAPGPSPAPPALLPRPRNSPGKAEPHPQIKNLAFHAISGPGAAHNPGPLPARPPAQGQAVLGAVASALPALAFEPRLEVRAEPESRAQAVAARTARGADPLEVATYASTAAANRVFAAAIAPATRCAWRKSPPRTCLGLTSGRITVRACGRAPRLPARPPAD